MNLKYTINCKDSGEKLDFEMLEVNPPIEHATKIQKWSLNIQEKAVREALIRRGWTPPPEEEIEE